MRKGCFDRNWALLSELRNASVGRVFINAAVIVADNVGVPVASFYFWDK
jgi:hypothetical protein